MLYTGDRQAYIQDWQANIRLGMIRSNIDIYTSFLENTPLNFVVNGLSKEAFDIPRPEDPTGRTRIDFARNFVNFVGDITCFGEQASLGLIEGVQIGVAVFKTMHHDARVEEEKNKVLCKINGEFEMISYQNEVLSTPYSVSVDPYHIFPDCSNGKKPKHVTERSVISQQEFLETYGVLIFSDQNELKNVINQENIAEIISNKNQADFSDFANIRNEIYAYENLKLSKADTIYKQNRPTRKVSKQESETTDMTEFKYTEYKDRIILSANGFPVYIGPNPYKKIMYDFVQAYNSRQLLGEGPAYLQFGIEDIQDSFFNNLVDNGRAAAHARYIADRNAFNSTPDVMDLPPGGILWADKPTENSFRPMLNPPVTDVGIINITDVYAQKLTGISEIDSGRASKLRVAAEGAALATATNRRMNGYVRRYMSAIGKVGMNWIAMFQHLKLDEAESTWGYVKDQDGEQTTFDVTAKDLSGSYNVTLDSQGLFAMSGESAVAKKSDVLNKFSKWMTDSQIKKLMKSVFRDMGLNPAYFLPDDEPMPVAPPNPENNQIDPSTLTDVPPEIQQGRDIAQTMDTSIDLGNQ